MGHHWDSGFMVNTPSWHRLENAVLNSSPTSWEDARAEAGLTWEVGECEVAAMDDRGEPAPLEGWKAIYRNDLDAGQDGWALAVQPTTYQVIPNSEFGSVIDDVLGIHADEDPVVFEALMSLYGGKQVVALCYFQQPLELSFDPSQTYQYLALSSRHDGQGGLRGIPTNVRVQCANTLSLAEMMDGRRVGFTIRHTSNWEQRLAEVSMGLQAARGESQKWVEFAEKLARWKVGGRQRENYLRKFLPASDDMTTRQRDGVMVARDRIRSILSSPTCEEIAGTGYGLLMASTEWSDHHRAYRTEDSFVSRQLLRPEPPKARASKILRQMAGVKG